MSPTIRWLWFYFCVEVTKRIGATHITHQPHKTQCKHGGDEMRSSMWITQFVFIFLCEWNWITACKNTELWFIKAIRLLYSAMECEATALCVTTHIYTLYDNNNNERRCDCSDMTLIYKSARNRLDHLLVDTHSTLRTQQLVIVWQAKATRDKTI